MDSNSAGNLRQIFMLLTLLVGGVALESQVSLQGSRPINKDQIYYHRLGDQNVDARLWEDPFQAVNQYQKRSRSLGPKFDCKNARENRKNNLQYQINSRISESITILGVLVSSGPYFVDAENRRRTRYAVLSGLASAEYHPENSENIRYLSGGDELCENSENIGYLSGGDELCHEIRVFREPIPPVLPYEWFKNEKGKGWVLVLWLDNYHFFQKPIKKNSSDENSHCLKNEKGALKRIQQLFSKLAKGDNREKHFKLIGSTSAADLRNTFEKIKELVGENNPSSISSEAIIQIQELLRPFTQADKNDKVLCRKISQSFSTDIKPTAGKNEKIRYRLIGPTESTYLMEMVDNVAKFKGKGSTSIEPVLEIYSTRATKDEDLILEPLKKNYQFVVCSKILIPISVSFWNLLQSVVCSKILIPISVSFAPRLPIIILPGRWSGI